MRKRYELLLLALLLALLTACTKSHKPAQSQPLPPSLGSVRERAQLALDTSASSGQRAQARDDTMSALLAFLKLPQSTQVTKADWEQPLKAGSRPLIRYYANGSVRVYAVTLPGSGVVPPGERVAVQYLPASGAPQAFELNLMPGGQVMTARALEQQGQVSLVLACALARGDGFVAYYQRDSRTGEFKATASAFRGLPSAIGNVGLDVRDSFLLVSNPVDGADWQPQFDTKYPLRLYLNGDLGLDWKGNVFALLDERNFNAFQGLTMALDAKASTQDRQDAWDKAKRKLPDYLRETESWNDDLTAKLPPGGRVQRDQISNLAVRLISLPAPDFDPSPAFTVVQQRSSNGLPAAQMLEVPGLVESFKLIDHQGLPGLIIISDSTPRQQTGNPVRQKSVTLLRLTGANTWEPASDWFGTPPTMLGLEFDMWQNTATLNVRWPAANPAANLRLGAGSPPGVAMCSAPANCLSLNWAGGELGGSDWVVTLLRKLATPGTTEADVEQAAAAVAKYLTGPEAASMPATELAQAMGWGQGVDLAMFQPDPATRVVGLPPNGTRRVPVVVAANGKAVVEDVATGAVAGWVDAKVVEADGARWLVLVGRGPGQAAILLYKWGTDGWQGVDALPARVGQMVGTQTRILYAPGQTIPVRGLYVQGATDLSVSVAPSGREISICDGSRGCISYKYDTQWVLK